MNMNILLVKGIFYFETTTLTSIIMSCSVRPANDLPVFNVTKDVYFGIGFRLCLFCILKQLGKIFCCHGRKRLSCQFHTIFAERKR